jgi:hypothetical protein
MQWEPGAKVVCASGRFAPLGFVAVLHPAENASAIEIRD